VSYVSCYFSSVDAPSTGVHPQVHEHVAPLRAQAGDEFVENLAPLLKKNKAPASDAGSSQVIPAKRPRIEVVGGKAVAQKRRLTKQMPTASG
jgi:hypothetical protein